MKGYRKHGVRYWAQKFGYRLMTWQRLPSHWGIDMNYIEVVKGPVELHQFWL